MLLELGTDGQRPGTSDGISWLRVSQASEDGICLGMCHIRSRRGVEKYGDPVLVLQIVPYSTMQRCTNH